MCVEMFEICKEFFETQYPGMISGVAVTFISGWLLWCLQNRYDAKRSKVTEEKRKFDLYCKVVSDIGYNLAPGVGNPDCPFELNAIEQLAFHKHTEGEIAKCAKEIVRHGKLCNAYGGLRSLEKPPGVVKELQNKLKELLSKNI